MILHESEKGKRKESEKYGKKKNVLCVVERESGK